MRFISVIFTASCKRNERHPNSVGQRLQSIASFRSLSPHLHDQLIIESHSLMIVPKTFKILTFASIRRGTKYIEFCPGGNTERHSKLVHQSINNPPEAIICAPLIHRALSSHKNPTAYAISSGCPIRGPTGVWSIMGWRIFICSSPAAAKPSVRVGPGLTAFTVHPYFGGNSFALYSLSMIDP